MKSSVLSLLAVVSLTTAALTSQSANAQSAVLAEMYGRGVHAYYGGRTSDAYKYLSMAIDNGIQDPRAYYFRGLVAHASGRPEEAKSDWQQGAQLEAAGKMGPTIGRSLARFQGSARLELEEIRQQARLKAMANAATRSQQRYGELQAAEQNVLRRRPAPSATPPAATAPPATAVTPPPTPPAAPATPANDPFADDMVAGEPQVQNEDALADAMNDPFADDVAAPAAAPAAGGEANPFGGGDAAAPDPFGTGAGGADAADPFGTDAGGAMDDPFGGTDDPFGN